MQNDKSEKAWLFLNNTLGYHIDDEENMKVKIKNGLIEIMILQKNTKALISAA